MFEDYCTSFKDLFLCAKYEECSSVQEKLLERHRDRFSKSKSNLYYRFYFDNNLIVSKTLALNSRSEMEQCTSEDWVAAFLRLSDLHGSVQSLHSVCNVSLDLGLCITYNILYCASMRVEPFYEYSNSTHHALVMTVHTLQRVLNMNGDTQLNGASENPIKDILYLTVCISKHILHHPPRECLLLIDVVLLALLLVLEREQTETINAECLRVVDLLISMAPQTRIHLKEEKPVCAEENLMGNFPLLRFGMNTAGDVLDNENCIMRFGTSFQTLLMIGTICCFRVRQFSVSLKYLQDKDILPLQFTFLIYYVKALVQLKLGDGERCVYFLSRCPPTLMDDVMQTRHHILQSQALMHLGNHAAALQILQKVLKNEGNVRLPITAFLIAQSYGALGQTSRQIESLDTLAECLNADVPVTPLLPKPSNGFEHRLLLFFHPPPEISLPEVLYASAVVCLQSQPKKASDQLLNLLRIIEDDPDCSKSLELPALTDLLHSSITALLKADCGEDAKLVCNAALEQFKFRSRTQCDSTPLQSLQDDVIALMLLAESEQRCLNWSEAQSALNKATKILKESCKDPSNRGGDPSKLFSDLLARVYLFKALINVERNFKDDASAFFQRALTCNPDDTEVLLHFAHHLLDTDQHEECLAIWSVLQGKEREQNEETTISRSIALQHLLGVRTSSLQKVLITNQIERLICK